jgi:hypothetical protein
LGSQGKSRPATSTAYNKNKIFINILIRIANVAARAMPHAGTWPSRPVSRRRRSR